MYMSQEMPNLQCFLARFWLNDNQMTIILENVALDSIISAWLNQLHVVSYEIHFQILRALHQ